MLKHLGVSRSGYRSFLNHKPSATEQRREAVKKDIQRIYDDSKQNYGAPKITEELRKAGERIAERTVGKYMRQMGIRAQWIKPWIATTIDSDFSKELHNVLDEQFNPDRPNAVWCTDITYIWTYDGFVKRYTFLEPSLVLKNPISQDELYERYRIDAEHIDYMKFMDEVFAIESSGSYLNAFGVAGLPYYDPYAKLVMAEPLDMERVRNGEPKYLVRGLYAIKYPELEIPFKIPMPRPVDAIFRDWEGPKRPEFRTDIPMHTLTGNQKWQLWCAEQFLNLFD